MNETKKAKNRERRIAYREKNKVKIAKTQATWYQKNKEDVKERGRIWRVNNKPRVAKTNKAYYQANKYRLAEKRRKTGRVARGEAAYLESKELEAAVNGDTATVYDRVYGADAAKYKSAYEKRTGGHCG